MLKNHLEIYSPMTNISSMEILNSSKPRTISIDTILN